MKKTIWLLIFLSVFVLFKTGYLTWNWKESQTVLSPTPLVVYEPPTPELVYPDAQGLEALVNQYRSKNHLPMLSESSKLCQLATDRVPEVKIDWSHNGFYSLQQTLFPVRGYMGENLAKDLYSNETVLNAWIHSPEHKANLDNPVYTQTCIETSDTYVVQEFASN